MINGNYCVALGKLKLTKQQAEENFMSTNDDEIHNGN